MFFFMLPSNEGSHEHVNQLARKAAQDEAAFEALLKAYQPFIFSQVKKTTGADYVDQHDDYASVGMIAFHEAVQSYDQSKGNFLSFCAAIIRNRVIDEMRRSSRAYPGPEPLYELSDQPSLLDQRASDQYQQQETSQGRRLEIEALGAELSEWGISFEQVYHDSPRQKQRKEMMREVVSHILSDADLLDRILKKRYLPVAELEKSLKIHRKKIEHARRYIIACILIACGDYPMLGDYVRLR